MAAKTPVYEADTVAELIGRLKSGEIPGSYVVQGLGGVGKGGKIRAVSAAKGSLGAKGKAAFDQEQRRQKQNKAEGKALSATAKESAVSKLLAQVEKNKAEVKTREASNTTAEEARGKQAKQWEAYVTGLDVARARGTLPKGFEQATPSEVGTTNLKENAKEEKAPEPVKVSGTDKPISYPTDVPEEIRAAAMAEYQRTGQNPPLTTEKVAELQAQMAVQKSKLDAAKKEKGTGGPFDFFSPGDWVDVASQAGTGLLAGAGRAIDVVQRPKYAINNALTAYSNPDQSLTDVWNAGLSGFAGTEKGGWMDVIEANAGGGRRPDPEHPGKYLEFDKATQQWVPAKELNPYLTGGLAFAGDVLSDPSTYVGVGTVAAGAKGIQKGARVAEAIDINNSIIKQAVKSGVSTTVTKGAERASKKVVKKLSAGGGAIGGKLSANEQLAQDLYQRAILAGESAPDALASVRVALEHEIAGDVAKQKLATLAERAIKDNKRIINLKVAGKEIPLGKVPIIDLPYKGVRAAKAAIRGTDVGEGLAKMFSTRYWFPGETHTLWNKANSLGVHGYTETHKEIREAFKGLSKADRRRVADATEQGISLASEFGTRGKDLGPAQKFFSELSGRHFDEAEKLLGKYSSTEKVSDYVYHHYRGGSPKKIKDIKKVRKARLEDGVTGPGRLTLQEAEDLGMRPIREADKILLAHTADHQRQMIRSMWDRKLIDNYAHVTDNPVLAQKLGLVPVKPPKLMKMAPGHKLYMHPDVKKVHDGVSAFMGKNDEQTKALWRVFDKGMRGWKMANTTLRPGHHIRNVMGDMFMNFQDGVTNPYRYRQGFQMASGDRGKLRIRVGNQVLNGDDIEKLWIKSGANQGFISSEFLEGRNPLLRGINEFSQRREMTGRYAHFIDVLVKEGKKSNLGANNMAGLYKIATEGGRRVNKWNINYADLTPFEKQTMKRVMPFYTWTRKAMPLMVESLATRPGRMTVVPKINDLISRLAGVDPEDMGELPYPQWLKEQGFARISDGQEPNVWSLPLPSQDLSKWFGGGTPDSVLKQLATNINPLAQLAIERATGRNLFSGAQIDENEAMYAAGKFGVIKNILDIAGVGDKPIANRINAATGIGTSKVTEGSQLGELRRQQDPLDVQLSQINKDLGDFEVHKLKYGYSVYNKHFKVTEKDGFSNPEDALIYAIGLSNKAKKGNK